MQEDFVYVFLVSPELKLNRNLAHDLPRAKSSVVRDYQRSESLKVSLVDSFLKIDVHFVLTEWHLMQSELSHQYHS
ncbi:hypothetical protein D3C79_1040510 [compost metagenome]